MTTLEELNAQMSALQDDQLIPIQQPSTEDVRVASVASSAVTPALPGVEAGVITDGASSSPELLAPASDFTFPQQPGNYEAGTAEAFKQAVEMLSENINNQEVVGQQLRKIMVDLEQFPGTAGFLADEDWGLMVRALRVNYGRAVATKAATKKTKKKGPAMSVEAELGMEGLGAKLKGVTF